MWSRGRIFGSAEGADEAVFLGKGRGFDYGHAAEVYRRSKIALSFATTTAGAHVLSDYSYPARKRGQASSLPSLLHIMEIGSACMAPHRRTSLLQSAEGQSPGKRSRAPAHEDIGTGPPRVCPCMLVSLV